MKKSILKMAAAAMVVTVAGYGVYQNQTKDVVSDFAMSNIEALAQTEIGGVYTVFTAPCPRPVEYKTQVTCQRGGKENCSPSDC